MNREARRLRREQEQLQGLKATVRQTTAEAKILRGALAGFYDQMDLIKEQESRIIDLRVALRTVGRCEEARNWRPSLPSVPC